MITDAVAVSATAHVTQTLLEADTCKAQMAEHKVVQRAAVMVRLCVLFALEWGANACSRLTTSWHGTGGDRYRQWGMHYKSRTFNKCERHVSITRLGDGSLAAIGHSGAAPIETMTSQFNWNAVLCRTAWLR